MRTKAKVRILMEDKGVTFVIETHDRGAFAELRRVTPRMAIFRPELPCEQYCLHRVFVPPVFRGLGAEHALLERVAAWADRQGVSIYNWASHHGRAARSGMPEDLVSFYREYGFQPLNEGDPEVMLRLPQEAPSPTPC
jgi:GNAT superfamily N-acetyltransferase